jgi:hypothetical protein
MRTPRFIVIVLLLVSAAAVRAIAWGAEGHRVVARVAWSQMTDAAKHAAQRLLGEEDFVTSSNWADEIRSGRPETYNWHFVDIPYDAKTYDAARDCKPTEKGDCIIAELTRAQHAVGDASLPIDQRKEALKFLIHFVGDLHQPLHTIDNQDLGGNKVHLTIGGRTTNLHAVWDTGIINMKPMGEAAYAASLIEDLKAHPLGSEKIDYVAWALEGHKIAVESAYMFPGATTAAATQGTVLSLEEKYETDRLSIVDRQLELAGARLALVLNSALR